MRDALVCPGCRTRTAERIDLRTLSRAGDFLACECGRRYPVIDQVPVVLADPRGLFRNEIAALVERDLPPEVSALLGEDGPDDAPWPRLLEHLSIYLDAHWGDRAVPPPDGPGAELAAGAIVERIAGRARDRVDLAVELGCSVGRIVGELAAGAERVIGLDLHFGAVRRARRLLGGETLAYGRRIVGRRYAPAMVAAGDRAVPPGRATLVCADALDPPLLPGVFDRVVALNLLDSVASPRQLVSAVDTLCAVGGEVILASPYTWQSGIVDDDGRLGGADPAADLAAWLRSGNGLAGRYSIEDEADLRWTLRRDARTAVVYRCHYLRGRKL
jgi:uncharacterized protein YbaR (Trm112 family)